MPKPGPAQRLSRRGSFGVLGVAAWLCLPVMGAPQPLLHAESAAATPRCQIRQKTPLFVGFAKNRGLDSFEASAVASHGIIREVKHWACGDSTTPLLATPSLQRAFNRSASLRLDRLQFDNPGLARAHVVLSDASSAHSRSHWRIDLAQTDASGWAVTDTRIATAQDSADP
jgi:hypothetical protein